MIPHRRYSPRAPLRRFGETPKPTVKAKLSLAQSPDERRKHNFLYAIFALRILQGFLFYSERVFVLNSSTKKMISASMLCAVSYILMLLSKFVPQVAGFLQFDAKDVSITIGGFLLGPWYAIVISLVVTFLEFISASHTGPIGLIMNFVSTATFCGVASLFYYKKRTFSRAFFGLFMGTICLTLVMLLWNYYITPIYMKIPREAVASMLPTVFLPFNLIKGLINSALILILYRPLVDAIRRMGLLENAASAPKKKLSPALYLGVAILAVSIPAFLYLLGVI